eukprot:1220610-Pyramimonas_sp.AAC.1
MLANSWKTTASSRIGPPHSRSLTAASSAQARLSESQRRRIVARSRSGAAASRRGDKGQPCLMPLVA